MPYIDKINREELKDLTDKIESTMIFTPGELNYVITKLIQNFLETNKETYGTYNAIVGALECAKLELYRRKIMPYENQKITQHGDVYDK